MYGVYKNAKLMRSFKIKKCAESYATKLWVNSSRINDVVEILIR